MLYLFLALSIAIFSLLFSLLNITSKVKGCLSDTRRALAILHSGDMTEDEKERSMQRACLQMGRILLDIVARSVLAVLAPLALLYCGVTVGLFGNAEIVAAASTPLFILIAIAVFVALLLRPVK
jgi:hypothetical protein